MVACRWANSTGLTRKAQNIHMDEKTGLSGMRGSEDFKATPNTNPVTRRSRQIYAHWRTGFTEAQIAEYFKINIEEVESDIAAVMLKMPSKVLASDTDVRNQIMAVTSKTEQILSRFREDLSQSAKAYIATGINPAQILHQYREVGPEDNMIEALRTRDRNPQGKTDMDDIALSTGDETILNLRREARDKSPALREPVNTGNRKNPIKNKRKEPKQRRMTLRIEAGILDMLIRQTNRSGQNLSKLVRSAISQYLRANEG